jgi:hypothetical protein
VRLEAHADAEAFLAAAGELLSRDEARHNLVYGICSTLIETPSAYEEAAYFWRVEEDETLAALLRTPPTTPSIELVAQSHKLGFAIVSTAWSRGSLELVALSH